MAKEVKLVIEDGDLAMWRSINNTFACRDLTEVDWGRYWNGLLIQLGDYLEFGREKSPEAAHPRSKMRPRARRTFASLQFRDAGDKPLKTCSLGEFLWLNMCAAPEGRVEPIRDFKAALAGFPDLLGRRSFKRFASITYWHNRGGYDISVVEHYVAGRLSLKCEFKFPDVETIEITNGGKPSPVEDVSGISTIVVNTLRNPWGPHGPIIDPPPDEP